MLFDALSLGDHLPDPHTGGYSDTQAERHEFWIDLGVHAERRGFAAYWLGEHHGSNYIVSAPQLLLAAIAMRTSRIRLGTAVSLLPNNDPVRLAEDFATLDLVSKGRAEIGFGSGFTEHTFRLFGQDVARSSEINRENLDLVQLLWTKAAVNWKGRFRAPIEDIELQPRTFSGGPIPINRATATSVETARDAGRSGHKLMLMTVAGTFADAKPLAQAYREAYLDAGHDPTAMSVSGLAYVYVENDGDAARRYWQPYMDNYRSFTKRLTEARGLTPGLRELYQRRNVQKASAREADFCGSPDEVAEQILNGYRDMGGFDRLICFFDLGGLPRTAVFEAVDLFAETVMPAVQTELGNPASNRPSESQSANATTMDDG